MELIRKSSDFLARKGVENPRLQVELLLAHVLKMQRLQLYLQFERRLTEEELVKLRECVLRRGRREPLQHIVGTSSFCGLELVVTPSVLIPRPETEVLAERAWKFVESQRREEPVTVLDFGAGSGCISIAIAANAAAARIVALEISNAALEVARRNTQAHEVAERIHFVEGSGFAVLEPGIRFDLIVSNPPYIPSAEIDTLSPEVRDFDPRGALDGGLDGLDFYRVLARQAAAYLSPGGVLMFEFGDGQEQVIPLMFERTDWVIEAIEPDLSGRPRIMIARPNES